MSQENGERMDPQDESPRGRVKSIQGLSRAFLILDQFGPGRFELDLNELTERTGLSKATVHRYCLTLRALDMLRYDTPTATYSLGARNIELGTLAVQSHPLSRIGERYIRDLLGDIERTLVLSVWDGTGPLVIRAHDNSPSLFQIQVRVGRRLDPFSSSQGCVYLAFSERIRSQFEGQPELAEVEPRLQKIRETGVSIGIGSRGQYVVAVPIGPEAAGTLALVSSVPDIAPEVTGMLKQAAAFLAQKLGSDAFRASRRLALNDDTGE
jgi:DNA-binding IclR family transcriptional regulator